MAYNKKLLDALDSFLVPDGKTIDTAAFNLLFDAQAENLASVTEPEDQEELEPWQDSTLKHKVFDYWESTRPSGAGLHQAWQGKNDLAWVLTDYCDLMEDQELERELFDAITKA